MVMREKGFTRVETRLKRGREAKNLRGGGGRGGYHDLVQKQEGDKLYMLRLNS